MKNTRHAVNIEDLRKMAIGHLPAFIGGYIEQGAGDGGGVRRNIDAFRRYRVLPRSFHDVDGLDTSRTLFGKRYASGFGISAVGTSGIYRRNADVMLAQAAAEANLPFILSGASSSSMDDVVAVAPEHTWYQLYGAKDQRITERMLDKAKDLGIKVLVYTVDYPVAPRSEVAARTGVSLGTGPTIRTFPRLFLDLMRHPEWAAKFVLGGGMPRLQSWSEFAPANSNAQGIARYYYENWMRSQTWADLDWLRSRWPHYLVVKGITNPDDAARALKAGADAVTVSNHGGNKLDCGTASLDALAAVRAQLGFGPTLLFDGGIRRGSHLFISTAVGATFSFVGRATLYGVTAGGIDGVRRALAILQSEFEYTMQMTGCRTLDDVARETICVAEGG
jgi:(S)-mandelate dehydrogenase